MLQYVHLGVILALATPSLAANVCQLLGPDYPAPLCLSSSQAFKKATSDFESKVGKLVGNGSENAYSVSISSAASNETLYELHFTPDSVKNATHGVRKVDADTVYRIGSITKVLTVYTFLVGLGDTHFNDPITKYVPELRDAKKLPAPNGAVYDDINSVNWEDVTIGNLASQLSGIKRVGSSYDLSVVAPQAELKAAGFPIINGSDVPTCGATQQQPPCTRSQFLSRLIRAHPIFPSSHSPSYSNIAYQILAYAFENLSGKNDFGQVMEDLVFNPLGMKSSSYTVPKSDAQGVIPGSNLTENWWNTDLGVETAGGGAYSSTNNMIAAARSILSSSLLPKAQTRRWLKPLTNTADNNAFVGAPWEILRFPLPNGHTTDLYNKAGDMGNYHSELILSPDHQLAITVMAAGPTAERFRDLLSAALANIIIPGVEEATQAEAKDNYSGTFNDASTNSSLTISVDADPGLRVDNLVSRGELAIDVYTQHLAFAGKVVPRLYPTTLVTLNERPGGNGTYTSRTGWRMIVQPPLTNVTKDDKATPSCSAWEALGVPEIGNMGLDEVVFNLGEDGKAVGVELVGLRLQLKK